MPVIWKVDDVILINSYPTDRAFFDPSTVAQLSTRINRLCVTGVIYLVALSSKTIAC